MSDSDPAEELEEELPSIPFEGDDRTLREQLSDHPICVVVVHMKKAEPPDLPKPSGDIYDYDYEWFDYPTKKSASKTKRDSDPSIPIESAEEYMAYQVRWARDEVKGLFHERQYVVAVLNTGDQIKLIKATVVGCTREQQAGVRELINDDVGAFFLPDGSAATEVADTEQEVPKAVRKKSSPKVVNKPTTGAKPKARRKRSAASGEAKPTVVSGGKINRPTKRKRKAG